MRLMNTELMKIAALFVGRFKSYEKTYNSIVSNVFAGHEVDVFFSHNAANTGDNLDDFAERFQVKSAQSMRVIVPSHIYEYTDKNGNIYANNGYMWLMFYHLNNGVRLIDEYCKQTGIVYDIVLYLRADMHFLTKVPFVKPAEEEIYIPSLPDWTGINDQMAYGTLGTMKKYAATFDWLDKYYKEDGVIYHPEHMTLHNIRIHGLQVIRFPMEGYLDSDRHYDKLSFCLLAN
jgi:hypothetical protein